MSGVDVAIAYLDAFCSGVEPGRLRGVLTADFSLVGPLRRCESADEYLAALRRDPPEPCSYRVLHAFSDPPLVNLIYELSREGTSMTVSQVFEISDGLIARSLLVFDTAALDR